MYSNQHPDIHNQGDYLSSISEWVEQAAADAWSGDRITRRNTQDTKGAPHKKESLETLAGSVGIKVVEAVVAAEAPLVLAAAVATTASSTLRAPVRVPLARGERGNHVGGANRGLSWLTGSPNGIVA